MKLATRCDNAGLDPGEREQLRAPASVRTWSRIFVRLLRLPASTREAIREELECHLRERTRDLMLNGMSDSDALARAIEELGESAELANRFEHAHTVGKRRLLMHAGLLGMGAVGAVAAVLTLSNPAPQVERSVFGKTSIQQESPAWLTSNAEHSYAGETTLEAFLPWIRERADAGIVLHWKDLDDVGVSPDAPFRLSFEGVTLARALDLFVDSLDPDLQSLGWQYHDGTLVFGDRQRIERMTVELAAYEVADIVNHLTEEYGSSYEASVGEITDLITTFVSPQDWTMNGGTLAELDIVGGRMFVRAPRRMHERVSWLLSALREDSRAISSTSEGD